MTALTEKMFTIFDRDEFSFKKLKEKYSEEELAQIKANFKDVWQIWKQVNLNVAEKLPEAYNKLLKDLPDWAKKINSDHWYLWDKNEMEFADHLSLATYLADQEKQENFDQEALKSSFLLGKFAFREQDKVDDMEEFIISTIDNLLPLYRELLNK
ncbi:hypothetical protein EJK17_00785 [Lactobacillus xujianguonis]|uniref:Uncharacterized protein n=1 Tax=Lactobacillus xujianguonis TaxID=2495899 RepID=A0A437SY31_9LACO|nr:HI_0552 family protein [Lactobacillus xujianguonis]RVU71844.1 hypothetical protein EJK17_00785 [Lactobacillus xujianguonis]